MICHFNLKQQGWVIRLSLKKNNNMKSSTVKEMNTNLDKFLEEERIIKIANNRDSADDLVKLLAPYIYQRKLACELMLKNNDTIFLNDLRSIINYCDIQIKLILALKQQHEIIHRPSNPTH